jgi:hypothetical protein
MELDYFVGENGVVVLRSHTLGQTLRQLGGTPSSLSLSLSLTQACLHTHTHA